MLCDLSERAQGIIYSRTEHEREGKRRGRPRGRPSAASHNASSIFRSLQFLPPAQDLPFDSKREIEMRCCCGMRSHIDFHTDASKYRLNFKSFKPTRIPFAVFRRPSSAPTAALYCFYSLLHCMCEGMTKLKHGKTREDRTISITSEG